MRISQAATALAMSLGTPEGFEAMHRRCFPLPWVYIISSFGPPRWRVYIGLKNNSLFQVLVHRREICCAWLQRSNNVDNVNRTPRESKKKIYLFRIGRYDLIRILQSY
jgi:hypothetical protein